MFKPSRFNSAKSIVMELNDLEYFFIFFVTSHHALVLVIYYINLYFQKMSEITDEELEDLKV